MLIRRDEMGRRHCADGWMLAGTRRPLSSFLATGDRWTLDSSMFVSSSSSFFSKIPQIVVLRLIFTPHAPLPVLFYNALWYKVRRL